MAKSRKRVALRAIASLALVAFLAAMALAQSASAAGGYSRFIPNGIDGSNAAHAWQQVSARANVDTSYSGMIAAEAGASSFVSSDYKAVGYTSAVVPGTSNSAVSSSAQAVPVADHGGSETVKKLIVINIKTGNKVYIMIRCGNVRVHARHPLPWKPFVATTRVRFTKSVTKTKTIICPSGQKVTGKVKVTVKGIASGKAWGKIQGSINAKVSVRVKEQVTATLRLQCVGVPSTPPAVAPPTIGQNPVQTNDAELRCSQKGGKYDKQSQDCTIIQINGNCSVITVVDGNGNVVSTSGAVNCVTIINNPPPVNPPPVEKSIHITSMTTLNDIPTGKSSGPFYITVNASASGGSVTIDPGIGSVSTCNSTTPTGSVSFSDLTAGNSNLCVILYAPNDPGTHPNTMTVSVTASLGSAFDSKSSTFGITYPERP